MPILLLVLVAGLLLYFVPIGEKVNEVGRLMFATALLSFCLRWHGEMLHAFR